MGGSGTYYDRDTTDKSLRTSRGFSTVAAQAFDRTSCDPLVLPKNRTLISKNKSPVVYAWDVTGSMKQLPQIIYDKMPMIAGQLIMQKYLEDPVMSLGAIGDVYCDGAPIQVCDFEEVKRLDPWLKKLFLEGGGGSGSTESYEFLAYFYARCYTMKNALTPIFIFTGDEGFEEQMSAKDLEARFGGDHKSVDSRDIFAELKQKFNGNVFLIHRQYGSSNSDAPIVRQWEKTLGKECVICLGSDLAIADTILGVISLASGSRTLDGYIKDIRSRPLEMDGKKYEPQSEGRIVEVRESLSAFAEFCKDRPKLREKANASTNGKVAKTAKSSKKPSPSKKAKPATAKPWVV